MANAVFDKEQNIDNEQQHNCWAIAKRHNGNRLPYITPFSNPSIPSGQRT